MVAWLIFPIFPYIVLICLIVRRLLMADWLISHQHVVFMLCIWYGELVSLKDFPKILDRKKIIFFFVYFNNVSSPDLANIVKSYRPPQCKLCRQNSYCCYQKRARDGTVVVCLHNKVAVRSSGSRIYLFTTYNLDPNGMDNRLLPGGLFSRD